MARPSRDRGSIAVALAAAAALLLLAAWVLAAVGVTSVTPAACQAQPAPSSAAAAIPAGYLADYRAGGKAYGIPGPSWPGSAKSSPTTATLACPACTPARTSLAPPADAIRHRRPRREPWGGAPVHPATQHDGGYGTVSVYDPGDAIPSAAAYLRAHGAPASTQAAIFAYNHSAAYVTDVLAWAARYAAGGAPVTSAQAGPACQQADLGPLPAGTAGRILAYAEAQLGRPYQLGATGPAAFDCSGLAMQAYRAAGITIPRTSQAQWAAGPRIPAAQIRPGDLAFFAGSDGTTTPPGHVGIVTAPA